MHIPMRRLSALAAIAVLAGCSGGGGHAALPPAPQAQSGRTMMNVLTSYTVYGGTASDGTAALDVEPLNAPSVLASARPVQGATVVYPDGSLQLSDALGNFDAGASVWAGANADAIVANPNLAPTVTVDDAGAIGAAPVEVTVNPFGAGGATQLASAASYVLDAQRSTDAASSPDLAAIIVQPAVAALFSSDSRTYYAAAQSVTGTPTAIPAGLTWSVTSPAGCPAPRGTVKARGNGASAVYTAPSGATVPNCPELVMATLAGTVTHSGAGAANVYDRASSKIVSGTLVDGSGKPVTKTQIDLYAASAEALNGTALAYADAAGAFKTRVAATRMLAPAALVVSGKTVRAFAITPSSISATLAAAAPQKWVVTANAVTAQRIALPPFERLIRDAYALGGTAREVFPFGEPQADGTYAAGSLGDVIAKHVASASGTIAAGSFAGWSYGVDARGQTISAVSPAKRDLLVVGVGAPAGATCPAATTCFTFGRYVNSSGFDPRNPVLAGATLATDGSWSQQVQKPSFVVALTRNEYNASHQTAGKPSASHAVQITQTLGGLSATLSDTWSVNAQTIGQLSITRVGTGPASFTWSGTGSRFLYRADGKQIRSDYSFSNGIENADRSDSFILASSQSADQGAKVGFTFVAPASADAATTLASGSVDARTAVPPRNGHAAGFTISPSGSVTLRRDPTLGGAVTTFQL